jgi:hypothetical protein
MQHNCRGRRRRRRLANVLLHRRLATLLLHHRRWMWSNGARVFCLSLLCSLPNLGAFGGKWKGTEKAMRRTDLSILGGDTEAHGRDTQDHTSSIVLCHACPYTAYNTTYELYTGTTVSEPTGIAQSGPSMCFTPPFLERGGGHRSTGRIQLPANFNYPGQAIKMTFVQSLSFLPRLIGLTSA